MIVTVENYTNSHKRAGRIPYSRVKAIRQDNENIILDLTPNEGIDAHTVVLDDRVHRIVNVRPE